MYKLKLYKENFYAYLKNTNKEGQDFQNGAVRRGLGIRSPRETPITLVKISKDNHPKSLEIDGRSCNKL